MLLCSCAVSRLRARYILIQRPDAGFIGGMKSRHFMRRLVDMLRVQPPVEDGVPASPTGGTRRRLGFCGSQIVLTDFYGRYHLECALARTRFDIVPQEQRGFCAG
eukprot:209470-Prymnesium_polylepis.1